MLSVHVRADMLSCVNTPAASDFDARQPTTVPRAFAAARLIAKCCANIADIAGLSYVLWHQRLLGLEWWFSDAVVGYPQEGAKCTDIDGDEKRTLATPKSVKVVAWNLVWLLQRWFHVIPCCQLLVVRSCFDIWVHVFAQTKQLTCATKQIHHIASMCITLMEFQENFFQSPNGNPHDICTYLNKRTARVHWLSQNMDSVAHWWFLLSSFA